MSERNGVLGSIGGGLGGTVIDRRFGSLLVIHDGIGGDVAIDVERVVQVVYGQGVGPGGAQIPATVIVLEGSAQPSIITSRGVVATAEAIDRARKAAVRERADTKRDREAEIRRECAEREQAEIDGKPRCAKCADEEARGTCAKCWGPLHPTAEDGGEVLLPGHSSTIGHHDVLIALDALREYAKVRVKQGGAWHDALIVRMDDGKHAAQAETFITRHGIERMHYRNGDVLDVTDVEGRAARAAAAGGGSGIIGTTLGGGGLQGEPLGVGENPHLAALERTGEIANLHGDPDDQAAAHEEAQQRDAGTK